MSLIDLASLVLAPTAVKDGKVYNAIPNDQDFTFSRGTEATRVNSAGLIEKARTNFLLQSNTFDTTWIKSNVSVTSGQSGYDGSNDAWKLSQTATSGGHYLNQSISQSGVSTLSIYAKAGEIDYIQIASASTNQQYANFDLTDGSIGNVGTRFFDAQTTSIGNGWYRLSVVNNGVSSLNGFYIVLITSKTSAWLESYSAANATDGLFIQSAQLEQGLVSTDVITTTTSSVTVGITDDLPRVDYSGGGCPSLLLESQRTNNIPQSEYFGSGSGWSYKNNVSVGNFVLSPEGKMNATELIFDGTANGRIERTISGLTSGANYSVSLYARVASGTQNVFFGSYQSAVFTLTTEWQRLERTQPENDTDAYPRIGCDDAATIEIWGFQHEAGSYPTSYIPTYSVSSTRVADTCSLTNASNLIGQSEGTLFADFEIDSDNTNDFNRVLAIGDGTTNNRIFIFAQNTEVFRFYVANGGAAQVDIVSTTSILGGRHKVAFAYKANDFIAYVDGVQVGTDTSGTIPSCSNVYVGTNEAGSTQPLKGGINQTILFPTRLTNDQLAELTK